MHRIIFPEESYKIMGACFTVYTEQGSGFLEAVYQESLEIELRDQGVPFTSHPCLALTYKGRPLHQTYTPDLVCFGRILVELKAVSALTDEHRAQVHNYLRATRLHLGLLINFGHAPKVQYERIVR